MDKLTREEWIDALRSGEYEQGQRGLCIGKDGERAYCCLGVACSELGADDLALKSKGCISDSRLDVSLIQVPINNEEENLLMDLNDEYNFTFDEIADVLESEFDLEVIKEINEEKEHGKADWGKYNCL